jgi:hypothetical protein
MAKKSCKKPEHHGELHLCALRKKALNQDIEKLASDPRFVCAICGLRVNKAENVCNPKPF